MSERQAHYQASERAADLAQLLVDDPHLYELLERARDAYNDLAAYMVAKCKAAGMEMPAGWLDLAKSVEKRRTAAPPDGKTAAGEE